jgi:phosphatidylinositol glycan class U
MDSSSFLPVLVSFRLLLAFIPLHSISGLQHDHQLSSPLTSYARCQYAFTFSYDPKVSSTVDCTVKEGLWLYGHDIDPYAGGVFRHVRIEFVSETPNDL